MESTEFTRQLIPLGDKLYRLALRLLENTEDAKDAVQEVYLRLWGKQPTLANYRSLEAVAMTTARNYCLDRLKSHAYRFRVHESNLDQGQGYRHHETYENRQMAQVLKNTIASLPETQKSIVHLRDVEEFEISEIAAIMQMNENAVRTALSRARQKVRENLMKTEKS